MPPLIDFQGVCLRRSGKTILTGIDWRMEPGENWAVVGANGSGKTTLLRIAGGMLFPSAGTAAVLGRTFGRTDLAALRRRIGLVSSALTEFVPPGATALQIVASGLIGAFSPMRPATPAELEVARALLVRAGLEPVAASPFAVLSAGERQKVLLSRALAPEPELLILDEAVAGLDLPAREDFLALAGKEAATGVGVVMVTHHIEEIPPEVTHALVLRGGTALACGLVGEVLTSEVLSAAFGLGVSVRRGGSRFYAELA